MIDNITMNHQKGEKFSRSKTAKSALCHRFKEHELRFSTSSLICVQINNDLFAVGTGLRISNTFQFLLMDWSYVIVFPRQNDWTSKCHYKASNLTVNQCLILSVGVFKEFECKVKTFVDSL